MPQETYTIAELTAKVNALTPEQRNVDCLELTPQQKRSAERKAFRQIAAERLAELTRDGAE